MEDPFYLERAVTDVLNAAELTALIEMAIELSDDPSSSGNNYLVQLKKYGLPNQVTTLAVNDWIELGLDLDVARDRIALAAHKSGWFKRVHKGRQLAAFVLKAESYPSSDTASKVQFLRDAIFASVSHTASDVVEPDDSASRGEE